MNASMSGDADRNLAAMMIPRHAGAIDTAKVELLYGCNPQFLRMARRIVTAQERKTVELEAWLGSRRCMKWGGL